jgi:hypothetical protein
MDNPISRLNGDRRIMMPRMLGRLVAVTTSTLAVSLAACSSSSTAASTAVDLTGTYNLTTFIFNGTTEPIDPSDGATLTCTRATYTVVGTGNYAQLLSDSGTYTATDTATSAGAISGRFTQESSKGHGGSAGSFRLSANKDTLSENVNSQGGPVQSTLVRAGS